MTGKTKVNFNSRMDFAVWLGQNASLDNARQIMENMRNISINFDKSQFYAVLLGFIYGKLEAEK